MDFELGNMAGQPVALVTGSNGRTSSDLLTMVNLPVQVLPSTN